MSSPTGWPTLASAACSAGVAATVDASSRRTASLVSDATSTSDVFTSKFMWVCSTWRMRTRSHQGGRSAGCTCGWRPTSETVIAPESTMRSAVESVSALSRSESQPREPGLVERVKQLSSGSAVFAAPLHWRGHQRRSKSALQSQSALALGTLHSVGGVGSSMPSCTSATYEACAEVHTATRCASA